MQLSDFFNGGGSFGNVETVGSLSMAPLLRTAEKDAEDLDLWLLDEAISGEHLWVTETDEGGEVPFLLVKNTGSKPVLILEGEELIGGKQNRLVNTTLVVLPESSLKIPVSCMEQGRWQRDGVAFQAGGALFRAKSRARQKASVSASIRMAGEFRGDQMGVWAEVQDSLHELRAESATSDFRAARGRVDSEIEDYVKSLQPGDGQIGAVFFAAHGVLGCEWLPTPSLLARAFPKIVRSFAFEVLTVPEASPDGAERAIDWWRAVLTSPISAFPSPGAGEDLRIENEDIVGSGLLWKRRIVHLSCFPTRWDGCARDGRPESRRQSAGERQRRLRRQRREPRDS